MVLSLFSEFIANDSPLIVSYKNKLYFPIFQTYTDADFGGDFPTPADYKDEFIISNIENNGWMIMPIIPFSFNTVDFLMKTPTPAPPSKQHW